MLYIDRATVLFLLSTVGCSYGLHAQLPFHPQEQLVEDSLLRKFKLLHHNSTLVDFFQRSFHGAPSPRAIEAFQDYFKDHIDDGPTVADAALRCPIRIPLLPCGPIQSNPHSNSTNVPKLPRWQDIRMMASFGDSITAGMFVRGNRQTLVRHLTGQTTEDRQAGGDATAQSLVNFAQRLTGKSIIGAALTRTRSDTKPEQVPPNEFDLGRISTTMTQAQDQLKEWIRRLKAVSPSESPAYYQWKMIHLLSGGINLCHVCEKANSQPNENDPSQFEKEVNSFIQLAYSQTPTDTHGRLNLFVNVYTLPHQLSAVYAWTKGDSWCRTIAYFGKFCQCYFNSDAARAEMDRTAELYNQAIVRVVKRWQRNLAAVRKHFRVSVDRSWESVDLRDLDRRYVSATDCFHVNECFHRLMAYRSWQTLSGLVPSNETKRKWYLEPIQWNTCSDYQTAILRPRR